uniref:Preprotein-translocase subunit g n=1 Tax=Dasya naccarioides TaxID=2007180 RepID=A0A1Z1MGJ7_9FLOR|nr:preprotein-translocase subunit g [Dasya naccarioides]ARW65200.1 preprotein-translocase subunit g [Dasya naccarioides]
MIKLAWYSVSLFTILLILFNSPNGNNINNFGNQNKLLGSRSNQLLVQKFIVLMILLFITLTILCSLSI